MPNGCLDNAVLLLQSLPWISYLDFTFDIALPGVEARESLLILYLLFIYRLSTWKLDFHLFRSMIYFSKVLLLS